jgi:MATE family multidrug resistance protein
VFISLPFSLAYLLAGDQLLRILTSNPELIELSGKYLPWVALLPVISFAAFLWDGIFIGATATKPMRNAMILCTLAIYAPAMVFGEMYFGNYGLWLAMLIFMLSRSLTLTFLYKKSILNRISGNIS